MIIGYIKNLALIVIFLSMSVRADATFDGCLAQRGSELRSLVRFRYPRSNTQVANIQIPKEIVVGERRVEIVKSTNDRWLWNEVDASPKNKGRILLGLEKNSSDAVDNAFDQIASISSLPIDRLASAVNFEQGDGFAIISLGDRTSIIVINQYVISIFGRRKVDTIARVLVQTILSHQLSK